VRQRDIARAAADEARNAEMRLRHDMEVQGEVITDLREGLELVRNTLRDCGYDSGALHKRIQAMHAELVALRQQMKVQSGVDFRPSLPPAV